MTTPRWTAAIACALAIGLTTAPPVLSQTRPASAAKSLARYVPAKDLFAYVEFDGLDAHAPAWKKTATYKLLNETKLGSMVEDIATQALDQVLAASPDKSKPKASELIGLYKSMGRDGFVLAIAGNPDKPKEMVGVMAFRDGAKNGTLDFARGMETASGHKVKAERRGSRSITSANPGSPAWWVEGDDLIVSMAAEAIDPILAVIDGKAPNASTSPLRAGLTRTESGFEPALVAFLDFTKLPPMPPEAVRMGVDGLKRIDYRWGFQDEAVYSVFRFVAPSPRRGVLAWFDQPTFEKNALPPIPAGLSSWTVFSLNPGMLWGKATELARQESARRGAPAGGPPPGMVLFEDGVRRNLGIRVKEDFLAPLGPKWVFYVDPELPARGAAVGKVRAALTAEVRDPVAYARTIDKVMGVVSQALQAQAANNPNAKLPTIRKASGPTPGYRLVVPPGTLPPPFEAMIAPTILVGKRQFVVGLNDAEARAAVAGGKTWTPGPDFAGPFAKLPGNLILLSVEDTRAVLPDAIAGLPAAVALLKAGTAARPGAPKFAIKLDPSKVPTADEVRRRLFPNTIAWSLDREGLQIVTRESSPSLTSLAGISVSTAFLLPAVQAAREAARRAQCVNNMKHIALAMLNYHDAKNAFPAAAIADKDGKPLLSWRVAILPYIDQRELYNEFHLDEPWDGPHNKPLIARMPSTYLCPSRADVATGSTTYKALVGGGAILDPKEGVGIRAVTDGTSNTMMVVESKTPVVWTKPDDIAFDPKARPSLLDAGSNHPGGFNALFADASVRFISNAVNLQVFRALITRAGGEVIGDGAF